MDSNWLITLAMIDAPPRTKQQVADSYLRVALDRNNHLSEAEREQLITESYQLQYQSLAELVERIVP